jgi:hypothetical protein
VLRGWKVAARLLCGLLSWVVLEGCGCLAAVLMPVAVKHCCCGGRAALLLLVVEEEEEEDVTLGWDQQHTNVVRLGRCAHMQHMTTLCSPLLKRRDRVCVLPSTSTCAACFLGLHGGNNAASHIMR